MCVVVLVKDLAVVNVRPPTDGHPLPRFHIQSISRIADLGICLVLELQQRNNLLDVTILVLLRDRRGLAKVGREAEGLADRRSGVVNILLLRESSPALKLSAGDSTAHQTLAADDTGRFAIGEDVEKGSLAGTRSVARTEIAVVRTE